MEYKIRDIKNNPELKEERDAEELAHELGFIATVFNGDRRKPGDVIRRLKSRYKFSNIKSEHTQKDRLVGK